MYFDQALVGLLYTGISYHDKADLKNIHCFIHSLTQPNQQKKLLSASARALKICWKNLDYTVSFECPIEPSQTNLYVSMCLLCSKNNALNLYLIEHS